MLNFGESFRKARLDMHLTQAQLAEKIGVTDKMISQVERGERGPSAAMLKNIAERLNYSADKVLGVEQKGESK